MNKNSETEVKKPGFLLKIKKRNKNRHHTTSFFKKLIENALIDANTKNTEVLITHENFENALIEEIQKKVGFEKKKKKEISKSIKIDKSQINSFFKNLPHRKINIIEYCLKKMKKFKEFLKFNNISLEQFEKLAAYIKHQFIPKGTLLLPMGKKAKKFFCIINGCISIRSYEPEKCYEEMIYNSDSINDEKSENSSLNKEILKEKEKKDIDILENGDNDEKIFKIKEYEIKKCTQGMCLCEWELIKNRTFLYNAYAVEDTNVFYLEKEYFDRILSSHIARSDIERKYFITARIPILTLENLVNVQPEFYNKNYILYTEFDKATEAILIYKGSAAITTLSNAKNKKDIYERKKELKVITTVERGGLMGLEIGKYNLENDDIYYDNTLIITEDDTIIFRLNIDILKGKSQKLGRNLKKFFNELYIQQNDFINNLKKHSLNKLTIKKDPNIEDKRLNSLKKLFVTLSNQKIELKENKFSKIKTQMMTNYLNSETNYYKNYIDNLIYKENKRNKKLTILEKNKNSKTPELTSKVFLSTEKKIRDCENLNIIKKLKLKSNKLIIKRNFFNNIFKAPTQLDTPVIKYNNNNISNNTVFNKVKINNTNIFNRDIKNIKTSNYQNYINSINKKKSLKFSINNSARKKTLNNINNIRSKYYNKSFNKYNNQLNKFFFDSGKFKIPLISLESE